MPVAEHPELTQILRHPEKYGLPKGVAVGRAIATLALDGARYREQRAREQQDAEVFAAYVKDRDAEASVVALQRAAREGRVF